MAAIVIDPRQLPLVENGIVPEHFVDFIGPVKVIGPNFWVTFGRFRGEVGVPIVRIGRSLETYQRNQLASLIEAERRRQAGGDHIQ